MNLSLAGTIFEIQHYIIYFDRIYLHVIEFITLTYKSRKKKKRILRQRCLQWVGMGTTNIGEGMVFPAKQRSTISPSQLCISLKPPVGMKHNRWPIYPFFNFGDATSFWAVCSLSFKCTYLLFRLKPSSPCSRFML